MGDLNRYNYDNMHNWLGMWCACIDLKKKVGTCSPEKDCCWYQRRLHNLKEVSEVV